MLIALVVLIIVMLLGIVAGSIGSPASWHQRFKVGLGLDLTSGTTVTLQANKPATMSNSEFSTAMGTAVSIMNNRVNGAGFTGATVVPEGNNLITVTVPNKQAQQVQNLVGTTAQLRFRQVLLSAPNYATSASPTPTPTPTPTASSSPSAKASASPTPSSGALGATGSGSAGQGLSVSAARLGGTAPKPQASPSPTASASPSPTPSPSAGQLATTSDPEAYGEASLLTAATRADFDRLNCADKNWQAQIYGSDANNWDNPKSQVVACDGTEKYALAASTVTGDMLKNGGASSQLQSDGDFWVNLTFNGEGTKAFGQLSTTMYDKYYDASTQAPVAGDEGQLDYFAIVLDGVPQSIAFMAAILDQGTATIRGTFTQTQATQLVDVLNYGALPLTFQQESVESITPEVGSTQLHTGLIAAVCGLFLVVCYSFLYYRGLGIVSISSLAIAAVLSYLTVVLLSDYESFALDLAGIAGLIVAIGITADSFVVFFERLRDEVREGTAGSLRTAVERGWVRARRTILVSDTVSFLAAALLWKFAVGDVKDFGFTLGITTLVDIIVVFLFTKPMVTLLARTRFFGSGHRLSGLDPARLGARSPWRGARRTVRRQAAGRAGSTAGGAASAAPARTNPKEA
jgi:preprotein translocase subunit SecD